MEADNDLSIQICAKTVADCTYVAFFAPPPGGCIYAATTKTANGNGLSVELLTPLLNIEVDLSNDARIDVRSGSFEVKNMDELMSILKPYITCAQASCLWDLTLTAKPTSKHPAFSAAFPDLRTYLPNSTSLFYLSQPHASSSSTSVPLRGPSSSRPASRHRTQSRTGMRCVTCDGCEDAVEMDPTCIVKRSEKDIIACRDTDLQCPLRSASHGSVQSTTCDGSGKEHNHDPTVASKENMNDHGGIALPSRPRSAATTCLGESVDNNNDLTCDSVHMWEDTENMECAETNISVRPRSMSHTSDGSMSCSVPHAHSNDPTCAKQNNSDTHQEECCVVVRDRSKLEDDVLNDPLALRIAEHAKDKEDVLAVAAKLFDDQDPRLVSHRINENDDVDDASGSSCSSQSLPGSDKEISDTSDANGSGDRECWICKDANGGPLIQPCLCKGSMQGVHLQCVEDWVAHVKQTKGERAQCPVCKAPYVGCEVIPGLARYTAYLGTYAGCIILRGIFLVAILLVYWAALKDAVLDMSTRAVFLVVAWLFFIAKAAAITFAVPPRRTQFGYWTIRERDVAIEGLKSLLEMAGAFAIFVFWCVFDETEWVAFSPFCLAIVPIGKWMVLESCSMDCLKRYAQCLVSAMMCPCMTMMDAWTDFQMMPRRYLSPMNHLFHVIFSIAILVLCAIPSNQIILITMVTHMAIILIVLFLHVCSEKWKLIRERLWWVQIQMCLLAVYSANLLRTSSEQTEWFQYSILTLSLVWYALNLILGITANWKSIKKQYNRWQRRHGSFTFQERQQRNSAISAT